MSGRACVHFLTGRSRRGVVTEASVAFSNTRPSLRSLSEARLRPQRRGTGSARGREKQSNLAQGWRDELKGGGNDLAHLPAHSPHLDSHCSGRSVRTAAALTRLERVPSPQRSPPPQPRWGSSRHPSTTCTPTLSKILLWNHPLHDVGHQALSPAQALLDRWSFPPADYFPARALCPASAANSFFSVWYLATLLVAAPSHFRHYLFLVSEKLHVWAIPTPFRKLFRIGVAGDVLWSCDAESGRGCEVGWSGWRAGA